MRIKLSRYTGPDGSRRFCFCASSTALMSSMFTRQLRGLCFWGLICCASLNLTAQESARIYYAEGADFALTVRGERSVFPIGVAGAGGVNLERGGIVHTGSGTFLEIQLIPSGTVIKLSENTSLVYNGLDETGRFADVGLLYGRLRMVTGVGRGNTAAVIRAGGVSVRVGEGDLGMDYILEPETAGLTSDPRPLYRVYDFRGGAEVFSYGKGGAYFGAAQTVSVKEGECLSVDISSSYTFAERKPLEGSVIDYWSRHNFTGVPPLPLPSVAIGSPPVPAILETPEIPEPEIVVTPVRDLIPPPAPAAPFKGYRNKNIILALGAFLTAAAIGVQAGAYTQFDTEKDEFARNLHTAAYVPMGLGILTIVGGIIYNPAAPGK
jgi:hypothetical protein